MSSHIFGTEFLQERLTLETSRPDFSSLPFRFAEIAKVILDVLVLLSVPFFLHALTHIISASDDLENPEKLRSLLKDLREARQAKSREGLKTLDHSELSVSCSPVYYLFIHSFYFIVAKSLFHGGQRDSALFPSSYEHLNPTRSQSNIRAHTRECMTRVPQDENNVM